MTYIFGTCFKIHENIANYEICYYVYFFIGLEDSFVGDVVYVYMSRCRRNMRPIDSKFDF